MSLNFRGNVQRKEANAQKIPATGGHICPGLKTSKCIYMNPLSVARASTRTYYGVFKLLDLIARITLYAEEILWPWLQCDILKPLFNRCMLMPSLAGLIL